MIEKLLRDVCNFAGVAPSQVKQKQQPGPLPENVSMARGYFLYFALGIGIKQNVACKKIGIKPSNAKHYLTKWCEGWDAMTEKEKQEILNGVK